MQQILPDVYTFDKLTVGRVYLLTKGDGLTIIDASIPSAGKKILAQLTAAGHAPQDVKRILLTHAHPDHVGAVPALIEATAAKLIVPTGERAALEGEIPIPSPDSFFKLPETTLENMQADLVLQDGDVLDDVLGGLHALHMPGHVPGQMVYWQPERRILFCGDVLFNVPWLKLPLRLVTVDMPTNIKSIGRLAALEPEVICFGHGKPITQNAAQRLKDFARKVGAI